MTLPLHHSAGHFSFYLFNKYVFLVTEPNSFYSALMAFYLPWNTFLRVSKLSRFFSECYIYISLFGSFFSPNPQHWIPGKNLLILLSVYSLSYYYDLISWFQSVCKWPFTIYSMSMSSPLPISLEWQSHFQLIFNSLVYIFILIFTDVSKLLCSQVNFVSWLTNLFFVLFVM